MMIKQRERQQLGPKQQFTWLYLARRSDLQGAPVLIWPCLTNRDIYTDHISSSNIYHLILQTYKNEIILKYQYKVKSNKQETIPSNQILLTQAAIFTQEKTKSYNLHTKNKLNSYNEELA